MINDQLTNIFTEFLPVIRNAAPLIASILSNPVGTAFGYLLPIIAHAFNAEISDPVSIKNAISKSSNVSSIFKSIESQHSEILKSLSSEINNISQIELNIKLWFK